jgi:hypothetical protein
MRTQDDENEKDMVSKDEINRSLVYSALNGSPSWVADAVRGSRLRSPPEFVERLDRAHLRHTGNRGVSTAVAHQHRGEIVFF